VNFSYSQNTARALRSTFASPRLHFGSLLSLARARAPSTARAIAPLSLPPPLA